MMSLHHIQMTGLVRLKKREFIMHKHYFVLIYLSVHLCYLAACQIKDSKTAATAEFQHLVSARNGVALIVDQKQAESPANEMVITIVNESGNPLTHSEHFVLEKYVSGIWYSILPLQVKALKTENSLVRPAESAAQAVSLNPYLENDLPPEKYRLVKFFGEWMDSKPNGQKK